MATLLLLLTLLEPAAPGQAAAETPSCVCSLGELSEPCGYESESCRCDDGHGWQTFWIYDPTREICEEYRVIRGTSGS